jgi:hypothetical protein
MTLNQNLQSSCTACVAHAIQSLVRRWVSAGIWELLRAARKTPHRAVRHMGLRSPLTNWEMNKFWRRLLIQLSCYHLVYSSKISRHYMTKNSVLYASVQVLMYWNARSSVKNWSSSFIWYDTDRIENDASNMSSLPEEYLYRVVT